LSSSSILHNHAGAVLACDFFLVVTATFQRLYVFVLFDIATRRVVHWNLTAHPTAAWTIQQFRNGIPLDGAHRFVIHDRDSIFAPAVDDALRSMSLEVLKTPVRTPQANAHCDRFSGTARRECLDWMIPLNEEHLRRILAEWIPTTTANDHIPRWVLVSQTNQLDGCRLPATTHLRMTASLPVRDSVGYTTITAWNAGSHE
jgi:transposase InsO family protein